MGRLARRAKPPPSGAVIFYGRSGGQSGVVSPASSNATALGKPPPDAIQISPVTSLSINTTANTPATDSILSSSWSGSETKTSLSSNSSTRREKVFAASMITFSTILGLLKDVSEIFSNVPYIKALAGVVQQIVQIVQDVRASKERSYELVEKVTIYARVVFEALRGLQDKEVGTLADLKDDLLQIASIFESIYDILTSLTTSTAASRFSRIIHREEILSRIDEQDRRLDTSITSFQLKSSIVMRMNNTVRVEKSELPPTLPRPPLRFGHKLRSKPQIMYGREKEIDIIVGNILEDETAHIAILGAGGIGKTSLALSVLHDERICAKYEDRRVFVSCEAASSADLLIIELAFALDIATDGVQPMDAVLVRLREIEPCVLVLDNFETPWDPARLRPDVESLLEAITSVYRVAVVVTLRGSQYPNGVQWTPSLPPLQPVGLESAIAIFRAISHKEDHFATKLIQAVDCVPLAVTLLANLAAVDGENTEVLWSRWKDESTSMIASGEDRLSSLEISMRLSLSGPRMRRNPDALSFLAIMCLLPEGISVETLNACDKGFTGILNVKKAVSTLRQNALCYEDSNRALRILSPVRLFVRAHHSPSPDGKMFLEDHFIGLARQGLSYDDVTVRKLLDAEVGNIEAILVDSLQSTTRNVPLEDLIQAVLNFCHYTYSAGVGSTEPISLAVEQLGRPKMISGITRIKAKPLGFRRFGLFRTQKGFVQSSVEEFSVVADPLLKLRADCLGSWGQILGRQSKLELAQEKFELAMQVHFQAKDIAGQAYDLHNLGCLLSRNARSLEDAHVNFQKALKLHHSINDTAGKAHDLMGSGQVFLQGSKFEDASAMFLSALEMFADINDKVGQASALNNLGYTMQSCSRFVDSEDFFRKALEMNAKSGNLIGQSESLAGIACAFLLRSRFRDARNFIEEAIALRSPSIDPDHLHILGRVFIAESNYDEAQKTLSRARDLHREMGDVLGTADDLIYLAHLDIYEPWPNVLYTIRKANELYVQAGSVLGKADSLALASAICVRLSGDIHSIGIAEDHVKLALKLHIEVGCILGQAFDHHILGCILLRRAEFEKALKAFEEALELHNLAGNVQGQADDCNKICETLLRLGHHKEALTGTCEALAFHIQIGDTSGVGDDLYVQACVFLEQSRLEDAEKTVRKALDLHTECHMVYNQARDLATLSSVLWELHQNGDGSREEEAKDALTNAIEKFRMTGAKGEERQCRKQRVLWNGRGAHDSDDEFDELVDDDDYDYWISFSTPLK